ncbi:MAG: hypothetical protein ACE14V_00425 [bacterium]
MIQAEQVQPIQWTSYDWGKLGITHLANAPFPDESRKDGWKTESETIPYAGHYDDNAVAIAIPKQFKPGNKIQFIVLFHGHINQVDSFMLDSDVAKTVCESGCNAILVAPEIAKNAADSHGGKMECEQGFARMMNELMATLKQDTLIPKKAQIGKIIVGGFSGGYRPTAFILNRGGMNDQIQEVWLLDAAYDFPDYLAAPFLEPGKKRTLRSIFTDHLATRNILIMSNLSKHRISFVAVEDDDLSTSTTSAEKFNQIPVHVPDVKLGQDELAPILRYNRIVFIHTNLPHDALAFTHRFIPDFIRESPTLNPKKK